MEFAGPIETTRGLVDGNVVDIGRFVGVEEFVVSLKLSTGVLRRIGELGMSLEFTAYPPSE